MLVNEAGRKGGEARARKLSKARLVEIARNAGKASGKARKKRNNERQVSHLKNKSRANGQEIHFLR